MDIPITGSCGAPSCLTSYSTSLFSDLVYTGFVNSTTGTADNYGSVATDYFLPEITSYFSAGNPLASCTIVSLVVPSSPAQTAERRLRERAATFSQTMVWSGAPDLTTQTFLAQAETMGTSSSTTALGVSVASTKQVVSSSSTAASPPSTVTITASPGSPASPSSTPTSSTPQVSLSSQISSTAQSSTAQSPSSNGESNASGGSPSTAVIVSTSTASLVLPTTSPSGPNQGETGAVTTVVSYGSSTVSVIASTAGGSTVVVVAQSGSVTTLTAGALTTIGSQVISAASSGGAVFISSGTTVVTLAPTGSSQGGSNQGTSVVSVDSSVYSVYYTQEGSSSAEVVVGGGSTATLPAGSTTLLGSQPISALSNGGVVIGSGSGATTVGPAQGSAGGSGASPSVVSIGSSTYTVYPTQEGGSSAEVIVGGTSTLILGAGSTAMLGSQPVSALSTGGVAIGSSSNAVTVAPAQSSQAGGGAGTSVVAVGSSSFTVYNTEVGGTSAEIIAAGSSEITLFPGSTTVLGGQDISAPASGGVIIGSGSSATTVGPAQGSSGEAGQATSVVSIGSSSYTVYNTDIGGTSAEIIAAGSSTITLLPGSMTVFGGQDVSAPASGGVIIGSGSSEAIVAPFTGSNSRYGTMTVTSTIYSNISISASTSHTPPGTYICGNSGCTMAPTGNPSAQATVTVTASKKKGAANRRQPLGLLGLVPVLLVFAVVW